MYFGGGEGEIIVKENNLGWVASVEDYNDLNNKLKLISNLNKSDLQSMKKRVFEETKEVFNLDNQMNFLIEKEVF